jgi:hypothetical protein
MSDLRARAGQTDPRRVRDGQPIDLRATRDGTPFTADWYTALALEGKCFAVNHGVATTAIATTSGLAVAKPAVFIHVPDNVVLIPVSIYISVEDTGAAAAIFDILAVASSVSDSAVAGASLTIMNVRTDSPSSSSCTATGTVTSGGTDPFSGNYYEFWRPFAGAVIDSAAAGAGFYNYSGQWSALDNALPPIVVGLGSLSLYAEAAAQAATIYSGVMWAELPESAIA